MTLYLVRHGETEWSRTRRHTGRTDVPLTPRGRIQAGLLKGTLEHVRPDRVLTSPLSRARDTAALAGFPDAEVEPRLLEWDYGDAEGRTTEEIREEVPGWSVWTHPMAGAEPLASVAARVDELLAELTDPGLTDPATTTLLVAHAHVLRILAARWCEQPAADGERLVLDPASVSVLGFERTTRCIERWNVVPDRPI